MNVRVGTAGWTVPRQHLDLFSAPDAAEAQSHLERYASTLRCVEINSTFSKSHRSNTWKRWAAVTPDDFRFSVKMPKTITHAAKLLNPGAPLQVFFQEIAALGDKLGPVLVQLPPKLAFDEGIAHEFFTTLRELHRGMVVAEPRHPSWFTGQADRLLRESAIARVAADPPKAADLAAHPGGWPGITYWRLHGAPRTYYSEYDEAWLRAFADRLLAIEKQSATQESWIIFDNTALGHAIANAIRLNHLLQQGPSTS